MHEEVGARSTPTTTSLAENESESRVAAVTAMLLKHAGPKSAPPCAKKADKVPGNPKVDKVNEHVIPSSATGPKKSMFPLKTIRFVGMMFWD